MTDLVSLAIKNGGHHYYDGYRSNLLIFDSKQEIFSFIKKVLVKTFPDSYMITYGSQCDLLIIDNDSNWRASTRYWMLELDGLKAVRNQYFTGYCLNIVLESNLGKLIKQYNSAMDSSLDTILLEEEGATPLSEFSSFWLDQL